MKYTGTEIIRSSIFAKMLDSNNQPTLVDHMEAALQVQKNPGNQEWLSALNGLRVAKKETEA